MIRFGSKSGGSLDPSPFGSNLIGEQISSFPIRAEIVLIPSSRLSLRPVRPQSALPRVGLLRSKGVHQIHGWGTLGRDEAGDERGVPNTPATAANVGISQVRTPKSKRPH